MQMLINRSNTTKCKNLELAASTSGVVNGSVMVKDYES